MISVADERGAVVNSGEGRFKTLGTLLLERRRAGCDLSERAAAGRRSGDLKGARVTVATTGLTMEVLFLREEDCVRGGPLAGTRPCLTRGGRG